MLLGSLYKIKSLNSEDGKIEAEVSLNGEHEIFDGHFPNNPVLPGVCQVEMIGELLGKSYNKTFNLVKAQNIKFLSVVTPQDNPQLLFSIQWTEKDNTLAVKAIGKVTSGEVCIKLSGIFE